MAEKKGVIVIEGHVQGLTNCRILAENGIPVWVLDTGNCLAKYSKYCSKFFKCPDFKSDELADFLLELHQKHDLDGWLLLPSNDHAVSTLSRNKTLLSQHFKVISPEAEIFNNIYNKENLLRLSESIGVPIPRSWFKLNSGSEDFPDTFPVITKGKYGLSFYKKTGKKAFISNNADEYKDFLNTLDTDDESLMAFSQELIELNGNKTISFTAFSIDGELKSFWIGKKHRDHPINFGTATYCESIEENELIEPSKKLLQALNFSGVCEIEFLKDPKDGLYKLIEINARTWLWVGLAYKAGINYPMMIYNHVNSIPNKYPDNYKTDLYWINIYTDLYFSLKGLIKGHYSFKQLFKTFTAKKAYAVFSWKDLKPFLYLSVSLINYMRNR